MAEAVVSGRGRTADAGQFRRAGHGHGRLRVSHSGVARGTRVAIKESHGPH